MRRTRCAIGATIFLASILALSCNNSYGIFKDIQGQTKQDGSEVFRKTTARSLFRLGSSYYASTAKLYSRPVSGSSWSSVSIGGSNSYFLRSAVLAGTRIYALLGVDTSSVSLYYSDDAESWTRIYGIPYSSDTVLDTLFSANGNLFAVSHKYVGDSATKDGTSWYSLYHYNGASFDAVTDFTDQTKTIRGVVHDGTYYYFATENKVVRNSDATNAGSGYLVGASSTIWAISYTGTHLYISMTNGNLYRDGFSSIDPVASIPLTQALEVPSASGNILVVGTDAEDVTTTADGYYEGAFGSIRSGDDYAIVANSSSIYNSTISGFPVHCFFYDSATQDLFICISPGASSNSYYGLYKSHYNGSSWDGWEAE